ncbi:uroporphyrinogen-III synthase [Buchnera aphidicola]|uniref:uroporphyrinogen-III synthase n=1 Tax=Buchnera aphidicola TaxID=9 RepID=UPI003464C7A7
MLYKNNISRSKIILLKGENGRQLIEKKLLKDSFNISIIECYKKKFKKISNHFEINKWRSLKIDTLVVTSGSILKKLNEKVNVSNKHEWLFKCKLFVVGKRLKKIAQKIGWKDIIISNYANNRNLLKIIKKYN